MEEERETHHHERPNHKRPILTSKRSTQLKILMCIDYIVNHIRNFDQYDFHRNWNLSSGVTVSSDSLLSCIDEDSLNNVIGPIVDNESFEDIVRIGVQAIVHAFYTKDWESFGPILHPRSNVLNVPSDE